MSRPVLMIALLGVVAAACTGPAVTPASSPTTPTSGSPAAVAGGGPVPLVLDVVASTSGPAAVGAASYLDGMEVAVAEANVAGGVDGRLVRLDVHDDRSDPAQATDLLGELAGGPGPAMLAVGPGTELSPVRAQVEAAGEPVLLVGGDLYSAHGLFSEVFQAGIPWAWQAKFLARYLVKDRKATTIAFVGAGPEAEAAAATAGQALAYWGGRLAWAATMPAGEAAPRAVLDRASGADAVLAFGPPADIGPLVRGLQGVSRPPLVAAAETLLASGTHPLPGTTACWSYPWAGWDPPIRRVRSFVRSFRERMGRPPTGLDQEGYDAVAALVEGLRGTRGRGGPALRRALETLDAVPLSGFPVTLTPDDHVLPPRDELGLFAVAGPDERLDPWQAASFEPWRAVMRTFTYDGVKTNVADIDRRVFFPGWQAGPARP